MMSTPLTTAATVISPSTQAAGGLSRLLPHGVRRWFARVTATWRPCKIKYNKIINFRQAKTKIKIQKGGER
jgi:hypothetical protein